MLPSSAKPVMQKRDSEHKLRYVYTCTRACTCTCTYGDEVRVEKGKGKGRRANEKGGKRRWMERGNYMYTCICEIESN